MQTLAALLTPTIGIAVAIIAFLQWRTAHQKVLLDLFDRRQAVYSKLETAALSLVTNKEADEECQLLTREGILEGKFLFGPDAFARISSFAKLVRQFEPLSQPERMYPDDDTTAKTDRNQQRLREADEFLRQMPSIFDPYMRMTHRRVRSPIEYIREKFGKDRF